MCEKAIKFLSNETKNYKEPENLENWCELAKKEVGYDKCASVFRQLITARLDRIQDFEGFTTIEKVRLVFLFSRPANKAFVNELKDQNCVVELNDNRRITFFSSPDGECVFESNHSKKQKYFKGEPDNNKQKMTLDDDWCENAIKFLSNKIKTYNKPEIMEKWFKMAKKEVGYDKSIHGFSGLITEKLDRIEDLQRLTLMEKVRLVFVFSRPVSSAFVEELGDNKCVVVLNENRRIAYFRSSRGTCVFKSNHSTSQRCFKGKPVHSQKKTVVKPARRSQNVGKSIPAPSPHIIPNPPEVDDVEMGNEEEEEAPEQKPEELDGLRDQHNNLVQDFAQNLKPEEDEDVINQNIHQEPPYNGPINYDDLDNGEYPEFMVPAGYQPPNQHNKRNTELIQENAKRCKIEEPEEPELNPPEISDVEMGKEKDGAAPEPKPEVFDDLRPSMSNDLNIPNQEAQAGDQDNNQAQNSMQSYEERVKIEDVLEEEEPEVIILDEKPEMSLLETISLLKLAEQIEALAYINFDEKFQQKILKAVCLFKATDQRIHIQEFNVLFNGMLTGLKRERIQNSNKNSMQLIRLFKLLERSLIRPLGEHLMVDTLKILEEEIEKLEGSEDEGRDSGEFFGDGFF
ncbi:unnamed protein product [Caenorhabditis nigoni]